MTKTNSIAAIASDVRDNKRRGAPRPGCDCVQCFGYCIIDNDAWHRAQMMTQSQRARAKGADEEPIS